jgi:succinyl-CoA synthetase beta subunit
VVVRLVGTNAEEGRALLEASGREDLHPMPTLSEAIAKAVALAGEKERADGEHRPRARAAP